MTAKRVLLITGHIYTSKRRAGFHWLADAYHAAGWDVTFFTAAISKLSVVRRDYRLSHLRDQPVNRIVRIKDRLASFVWYTNWHPANLRSNFLNALSHDWFNEYGDMPLGDAESLIANADLIIFESTPGILLFDRSKRLNTRARFVYRVSDDLRYLRNHPVVLETEDRIAPGFDLVSSPCEYIHRRFARLPQARLHCHAVRKDIFDAACNSPYDFGTFNAIFTGNAYFDVDFLACAARLMPEWHFHIFGDIADLPRATNIIAHGERPFVETVPYIKYADIGLQNLSYRPGAESFTDSLKVLQYTYCRLPIVVPEFLRCSRENFFYYSPGKDDSIRRALADAKAMERSAIKTESIHTWDELASELAGPLHG